MKPSLKLLVSLISIAALVAIVYFLSQRFERMPDEGAVASQLLWQEDDVKIVTGVLLGALYGTPTNSDDYVSSAGIVFAEIQDGDRDLQRVMVSGDVLMHVDFVSDSHIGIDVTDSVGRRPVAFVVNRETQEVKTVATDTNGTYLAGAHSGDKMLMLSNSGLSITDLDQQKLASFPKFTVGVEGMDANFRFLDGAFSPDDTSIVVMGVGTLEGSEDRGGERNVFWVLKSADVGAPLNTIAPLGQIDADIIKWESDAVFSLWQTQGDNEVLVARFGKSGQGDSETWSETN